MKKTAIMLLIGIITSIITTKTTAQHVDNISKEPGINFTPDAKGNSGGYKSTARLNKANSRALSNFKNVFKNAAEAKWFVGTNVILATFTKDDIQTRVVYDKRGSWIHTLQIYKENKMPADVRSLVKRSTYFDYDITLVNEVNEGDITFYIANLKNGNKFKQVSVYEGEINVLKEFDLQ